MSKIKFGRITSVNVSIVGMTIHLMRERTLTLGFASEKQDYQCLVNLTQANLDAIAHCLETRPSPPPKYLVFDMDSSFYDHAEEATAIGLEKTDQDLLLAILRHAPSLLSEHWLTNEDALKLVEFQKDWIKNKHIQD